MKTNKNKHRGIGFIWLIISFMALLAISALVIDFARYYLARHQLQNAADAAALVGARYVADPNSSPVGYTARQKATEFALYNHTLDTPKNASGILLNSSALTTELDINMALPRKTLLPYFNNSDIHIGSYINHSRLFRMNHPHADAMLVLTRKDGFSNQQLPLIFASIFDVQKASDVRYALAKTDDAWGAGLHAANLEIVGRPILDISEGGSIRVRYDVTMAGNSQPDIRAERMYVGGNLHDMYDPPVTMDAQDNLDPTHTDTKFMDPYRLDGPEPLYEPTIPPTYLPISETSPATAGPIPLKPGYYPNGFDFGGNAKMSVTLQSGIYQLGGAGLQIGSNVQFDATSGVMFHIVNGGKVNITTSSNGNVNISALTEGPYKNIAIFQSRTNTTEAKIQGTASLNINGELYFPNNLLEISGSGSGFGTRLVVDTLRINGKGSSDALVINYEGRPKIADSSYLVE
jgi:hypothetical protein